MADVIPVPDVRIIDAAVATQVASVSAAGHLLVDLANVSDTSIVIDTELTLRDFDSGGGTDNVAVVGLVGEFSGGAKNVKATTGGALTVDLATIAGSAPSTAGKIDVKGADGDVFVRQGTAANLNATVVQGTGSNLHAVIDSGTITTITNTVTVDTELPAAAALADGAAANPTTPTVGAVGLVMNATTVDRQRAVVNGLDSTGTGIAAAGVVGQLDDVSTGTVSENQFAPIRISSRRAQLIEGVASGTAVAGNITQLGGTTIDTNSGNKSAGTQRVVLATDQPALTNKLLVTPDAGQNPHSVGVTMATKGAKYTSAQTSTNFIAGTGGQRIYVSQLTISTGGTTAGRVSIYWGTGAFTSGTSETLFDGEFAPSATVRPGAVLTFPIPVGGSSATGDNLRVTTDAGITVYLTAHYYKI